MQAVCQRAYPAALYLLDTAKRIATGRERIDVVDTELLMSMLFPPGSSLDNSPLHILCCNDMCSFTWTGDEHINQVACFDLLCVDSLLYSHPQVDYYCCCLDRHRLWGIVFSILCLLVGVCGKPKIGSDLALKG